MILKKRSNSSYYSINRCTDDTERPDRSFEIVPGRREYPWLEELASEHGVGGRSHGFVTSESLSYEGRPAREL